MKDTFKRARKALRPGYSSEFKGKHEKPINRRIARKMVKRDTARIIHNNGE